MLPTNLVVPFLCIKILFLGLSWPRLLIYLFLCPFSRHYLAKLAFFGYIFFSRPAPYLTLYSCLYALLLRQQDPIDGAVRVLGRVQDHLGVGARGERQVRGGGGRGHRGGV